MPSTKSVHVAGREYLYFVTARTNAKGKPILVRLPARSSPQFGATYAALMGAKTKALELETEMTVPEFIREYERSSHFNSRSDGTQRLYGIYLKLFAAKFPTAPAGEIERRDILQVSDTLKPGAANSFVRTVAAMYQWGRKREALANDPCKDIDMQELGEHEPWPAALLDSALESEDATVRLGVHLLFYTAQRIGDVVNMRWGDIKNSSIEVTQQKTGRELNIRLHRDLLAELAKHGRTLGTIISVDGKPIRARVLREKIQAFATGLGHKIVPHGLRKNAVNALLEAGCTVAQTAAISGQTLQLVEHYARRRDQTHLSAAAVLQWENGTGPGKASGKYIGDSAK